jgi:putative NIF3 family GTP cyclohydrolase 1 type 2
MNSQNLDRNKSERFGLPQRSSLDLLAHNTNVSGSLSLPQTRRAFLGATAALAAAHAIRAQGTSLTAAQVIEAIRQHVGIPWRETTVDTVKAGNPDTPVKGIATTMVATLDLLRRASAAGRNMIIVHEPTFYSSDSNEAAMPSNADDPLFQLKKAFIEKNDLVVWRFHDHWHGHKPDGIISGMAIALGWDKYQVPDNVRLYNLPQTTLEKLAESIRERLKIRAIRIIGDPQTVIRRAAFNPGSTQLGLVKRYMYGSDVDVLVCGEPGEWGPDEYARDAIASGQKKGMIILGHDMSEEWGMQECAKWLKTFITSVPVEFMPAGEVFWVLK